MRTIRDANLSTPKARERLAVGHKPHWRTLIAGTLHLGYRRRHRDVAGTWIVRRYIPDAPKSQAYRVATLGVADDLGNNGAMTFADAQRAAYDAAKFSCVHRLG